MREQADLIEQNNEPHRGIVLVAYLLGALGIFTAFVPILIALIICYIKRPESQGTIYYSHYDWLISTFWIGVAGLVISLVTWFLGIGIILYFVLSLWLLYRFVKGLLRYSEKKAVV